MDSYIKDRRGGDLDDRDNGDNAFFQRNNVPKVQHSQISKVNSARDRMQAVRMQRNNIRAGVGGAIARVRRGEVRRGILGEWNSECEIRNVSIPQLISGANCSKRYRITLTWADEYGKPHRKDVNFGEEGKAEYIDHKNTQLRDARIAELKEETLLNPLHSNYWKFHLLNKYPSLDVAFYKFMQENSLTDQQLVLKKEFKQSSTAESQTSKVSNVRLPNNNNTSDETNLLGELADYRYEEY